MNYKIGRNDPCPCGSGKKYKQCCAKPEAPALPLDESHDGAIERAMTWLAQHHRKGFSVALADTMKEAVASIFEDEQDAVSALTGMQEELLGQLRLNATELLLAEGEIQAKGGCHVISDLLLGPQGPAWTMGQRAWIQQLAQRPLRLYDITEVSPGVGVTVCDALATTQPPVSVLERSGSQSLRVGMQVGARLMQAGGQYQFSGAIYPFSMISGHRVVERLREIQALIPGQVNADSFSAGLTIMAGWLEQYLLPPPMPQMIDAHSGDPVLLTTDHYTVLDWDGLSNALAAQADVEGDRTHGWSRLLVCEDGQTRPQASINPEANGTRVGVFYQTARKAETGRAWFDALAGESVKFQLREVSDPRGALSNAGANESWTGQSEALPAGLTPEMMANAIESVIKRSYTNWADEELAILQNRTPRQAIKDAAGLERVKGLLRSYEEGEAQMAAQQGRRQIDYQFLWDALDLQR